MRQGISKLFGPIALNWVSIYSWSIGHILEHEFFCLGWAGSKEKKVDLSFSGQLLRVFFSTFWGQKKWFFFLKTNLEFFSCAQKVEKNTLKSCSENLKSTFFLLVPAQPKWPKLKNSCSKIWPIDQLYIELGTYHKCFFLLRRA